MPNPYIPRERIREWVDEIDQSVASHKQAINYLLNSQRRLSRFVMAQSGSVKVGSRRTKLFIQGITLRLFDLAGGKLGRVSDEDIRNAEARVAAAVDGVLPLDEGFADRVRQVEGRAQPHLIDECLSSIFEDEDLDRAEMAKMFFLMWVVIEALDAVWKPPLGFAGQTVYAPADGEPKA